MLTPSSEVVLSYLTGLAPVGELFEPKLRSMMADLGYRQKVSIYRCLGELIRAGCVKKIASGANGTIGVLAVVKRLEAHERRHLPPPRPDDEASAPIRRWPTNHVSREDWYARLAEMPDDTRGLTALVLGDPIPNDQRRRRVDRTSARTVSLHKTPGGIAADPARKEIA